MGLLRLANRLYGYLIRLVFQLHLQLKSRHNGVFYEIVLNNNIQHCRTYVALEKTRNYTGLAISEAQIFTR